MLTPSLRQRHLFDHTAQNDIDADDLFSQSPTKSSAQAHLYSSYTIKPQPIPEDDEEGAIFLAPQPFNPFFPASSSQPLRTPVKQSHSTPPRSALALRHVNGLSFPVSGAPPQPVSATARVGVGTKRKSTSHLASTPLRTHTLTPLKLASSQRPADTPAGDLMFDRLAPLPAPRFTTTQTPQSKVDTDVHLRRQTATLTRLKIADINDSGGDFAIDNDSGCELEEEDPLDNFLGGGVRVMGKSGSLGRAAGRSSLTKKGKAKEEVAEAISPGGHITKRRARSRPLSTELLESLHRSPSPPPHHYPSPLEPNKPQGVAFPSGPDFRNRTSSSSSSETGSPLPRRRINGTATHVHPYAPKQINIQALPTRAALNRAESASSATLFFGPAIPEASGTSQRLRSRTNTGVSMAEPTPIRSKTSNRHSYSGPGFGNDSLKSWNTIQTRNMTPSPRSSPSHALRADLSSNSFQDDDEDMFFGDGPADSSFIFNLTEGTPSPRSKKNVVTTLPKKYKPRDSGVVVSDDEDDVMSMSRTSSGDFLHVIPRASTSASSIYSDGDDGLVTPGVGPEAGSGWPGAVFVAGADDISHGGHIDVDAFIVRTLNAAAKGPQEGTKKVPGTPVKRVKTTYLNGDRPWQSAVAAKVGIGFDWDGKKGKIPRKSLPAAFPALGASSGKSLLEQNSDSEDEEDSPSTRKDKYLGLGLGRPAPSKEGPAVTRTRWLMRRSSSGAFSSGSDSTAGTPTRKKGKDWHLPMPRVPVLAASNDAFRRSFSRSTSGSSTSSTATLHSPTKATTPYLPIAEAHRRRPPQPNLATRRLSGPCDEEQPGRFERDFVEIDELGSGEFGKVIKVRCKHDDGRGAFAIKKSQRFEGVKHRLRLREEVDILKHLSNATVSLGQQNRHPNVLAYIDSWEEAEGLYIQTELCESGNLARFLWEYGRAFPRLDEARVWKIIVDLSNGLRFIHDAGVIHLDLKPSNVFVTAEGRFKIGDFGMASLWPRPIHADTRGSGFEREGDKLYLAPEVLQGQYGKAADVFSFGMTILETASNIVVPDQGEAWHRLRQEDFSQVDLDDRPELLDLIRQMMRTDPRLRINIDRVWDHPVVSRARAIMERVYLTAQENGTSVFAASPLAGVPSGFLEEVLGRRFVDSGAMDVRS
ncbi:hypothetical protein BD779DRAFT_1435579 [Infundibulicybe gibba]|nr:hypothetical protein BD779DRAFT_1435579 [Infundibulicybe gibba]